MDAVRTAVAQVGHGRRGLLDCRRLEGTDLSIVSTEMSVVVETQKDGGGSTVQGGGGMRSVALR